ncbi:MAG: ATP-binding cassette domain-containing protein [Clostridia bacterium]|nr:ATP-binding cassette domain-containing protein [Clostridia bacterium]
MLEIRNITKIYNANSDNKVVALDNVSINFGENGMIFLLGKSGSGKSTVLNTIGGLDSFDEGEVLINGRSSATFSQKDFDAYRNTYIGFIFQEYNVLSEFSVEKNIALAMELQGKKPDKEKIEQILELVDMKGFGKRKPNQLSGGQKQRLAIARALIKEPQIIMGDEPTGALDSRTSAQVFDTLKKLSNDKLVIIVSHDRESAEIYADRIIELKDGKVISDRTKHRTRPVHQSDAVTLVNNSLMQIKAGTKLNKAELNYIADSIASSPNEIFITSNRIINTEIKKTARIDENGNGEIYTETTKADIKGEVDANKEFVLTNSKLHTKDAMQIGLSSLKNKKGKLIISMVLTIIAMLIFGFADTISCFNANNCMIQTVIDSKAENIVMTKKVHSDVVSSTKATETPLYDSVITEKNIRELQKKYTDMDFLPGIQCYVGTKTESDEAQIRNAYYIKPDENEYAKYNISLVTGRLPSAPNEVALTLAIVKFWAHETNGVEVVKESGQGIGNATVIYPTITEGDEYYIVGRKLNRSGYRVTGVVDTHADMTKLDDYFDNKSIYDENKERTKVESTPITQMRNYGPHFALFFGDKASAEAIATKLNEEKGEEEKVGSISVRNVDMLYPEITYIEDTEDLKNVIWLGERSYFGNERDVVLSYGIDLQFSIDDDGNYTYWFSKRIGDEYFDITQTADTQEKAINAIKVAAASKWKNQIYAKKNLISNYFNDEGTAAKIVDNGSFAMNVIGITYEIVENRSQKNRIYMHPDSQYLFGKTAIQKGSPYRSLLIKLSSNETNVRKMLTEIMDYSTLKTTYLVQNDASNLLIDFRKLIEEVAAIFWYVGIGFALFSATLIMSYISTSISYKKKEIGILRALGTTGRDVYRIFTWESLIILGVVAIISCLLLGAGGIVTNIVLANKLGMQISLIIVGIRQFLIMILLCLAIAFLSSFLPTRKISKMQPIDAMQDRK